jgi:hypothetical protein
MICSSENFDRFMHPLLSSGTAEARSLLYFEVSSFSGETSVGYGEAILGPLQHVERAAAGQCGKATWIAALYRDAIVRAV